MGKYSLFTPWKTSGNLSVADVCRVYEKEAWVWNELIKVWLHERVAKYVSKNVINCSLISAFQLSFSSPHIVRDINFCKSMTWSCKLRCWPLVLGYVCKQYKAAFKEIHFRFIRKLPNGQWQGNMIIHMLEQITICLFISWRPFLTW